METGRTDLLIHALLVAYPAALWILCATAFATDFLYQRIFNWLTFPAMLFGIAYHVLLAGWAGLATTLLGLFLGFLLFAWMYALKAMGAGDVKLLMALGALGGGPYVLDVAVVSVLVGGVFAVGILFSKGRLRDFSLKMARFVFTALHRDLALETPVVDRKLVMPFGMAIAIAGIWVHYADPLLRLGVRLWPS